MDAGHGSMLPQNMPPPYFSPSPDLRTRVVEILASTANGCLTELGYWPGMPQKMQEIEQTNLRYEEENLKLWQDNRLFNQELERIKDMARKDLETAKREVQKVRNEKQALLQQHSGDSHYRQLLTDHHTLQAFYNAACMEIRQLRDYLEHHAPLHPMSAHHSPDRSQQGSSAPSPTVPAIHNHPMSRKVPNGQNGQGIGPARQSASQPNMHPPPPPPPPPQPNGNTPDQTLHRRGSSSTGRTPAGSPHTEQMNMSNPGSRPPSSSSNGRRMSRGSIPIPHAPPPQALLAERHPPPARTVPSHPLQHPPPPSQASSITPQPMNIPSAPMAPPLNIPPQLPSSHPPPMTPTTPTASGIKPAGIPTSHTSEVLNPVQRRSAFAPFTSGGQPTPTGALTATSSQSSNLSNARERSSSAEVPLAQELAKRQRDTSNQNSIDHLNKKPRIEEAPITGESSIQDNLHQVAPGIPDNPIPLHQITPMDQYIVAGPPPEQEQSQTTPQAQPMSLVSPTEMLQDSPQPPPATEIPGQMPESVAEEPDEDGEEVELDADGLYPAEECLKEIMSRDKEQPNQQYCALCVARFASGHLAAEPAPFINATTEELVLHCTTEHQEVWNQLREPE